jgi:hypothetical protein
LVIGKRQWQSTKNHREYRLAKRRNHAGRLLGAAAGWQAALDIGRAGKRASKNMHQTISPRSSSYKRAGAAAGGHRPVTGAGRSDNARQMKPATVSAWRGESRTSWPLIATLVSGVAVLSRLARRAKCGNLMQKWVRRIGMAEKLREFSGGNGCCVAAAIFIGIK